MGTFLYLIANIPLFVGFIILLSIFIIAVYFIRLSIRINSVVKNLKNKNEAQKAAEILFKMKWHPTNDEYGAIYYIIMEQFDKCISIGKPAINPLIDALNDKKSDAKTRLSVVKIIGKIDNSRKVINALVKRLKDKNWNVRMEAARSLHSLQWQPTNNEYGALYYIMLEQFDECIKIGEPAVEPLLETVMNINNNKKFREAGIKALGNMGVSTIVESLTKLLQDEDKDIRKAAAESLGKIKSNEAVISLISAINDDNKDVRMSIIKALGAIGTSEAIDTLILILNDDRLFQSREAAVEALGEIGNAKAIKSLIEAMKYQDLATKISETLFHIGKNAVEPLINALNHDNAYIREYAAESLGKIGDISAVAALTEATKDNDPNVRYRAKEALSKLNPNKC